MLKLSSRTVMLAVMLVGVHAWGRESPPPPSDVDELIRQIESADPTKITLAAGKLIDLTRQAQTSPVQKKKIQRKFREFFNPGKGSQETKIILLKVLAQKKEKGFNADIVQLACHSELVLFEHTVNALKAIGDATVQDRFIAIFKQVTNPIPVRVRAIRALNHLSSWKAIPDLIQIRGDSFAEISSAAQQSLEGILGYPWAIDVTGWKAWWAANKGKSEPELLRDALKQLQKEAQNLLDPKSLNANLKALDSGIKSVREKALNNLSQFRDPASIDELVNFLSREPYAQLRAKAVIILGNLAKTEGAIKNKKDEEIAKRVRDFLEKEMDPRLTKVGVEVLGNIGRVQGMNLIRFLIPFLSSEDAEVRALTAASLGKIDGDEAGEAVDPLCKILTDPKETSYPKREAANALGLIGNPKAVPALVQGLASQEVNVRWSCANALGNIGELTAVESLHKAMAIEKEDRILEVLVKALHNLKSPKSVPVLARLILHNPGVAQKALEAILAIGEANGQLILEAADILVDGNHEERAIQLLTKHLPKVKGDNRVFRVRLAECLEGKGRSREAAEVYLELAAEAPGEPATFEKLLRSLGQIKDPEERGRWTAVGMTRLPDRARALWEGPLRDLAAERKAMETPFVRGLVKGWKGTEPQNAFFDGLLAFLGNPDGKLAASAHELLAAWTGRKVQPLAPGAKKALKDKALAEWRKWLAENKSAFPFGE
ncbi:MAG: HEAT repeat domain-containing protein [Planctomycetota bacterium]|jgi:HEAT repeat protein